MRSLFWLLVVGLIACVLVFKPQMVGTNSDLAPATTAHFHAAWACDFDRCYLDIGLK
jgi:hypothetical protein